MIGRLTTGGQADRQTDRLADRQTSWQTDKLTDKLTTGRLMADSLTADRLRLAN